MAKPEMTVAEKIDAVAVIGDVHDCETLQWKIETAGLGTVPMHEIAAAMRATRGPARNGAWTL